MFNLFLATMPIAGAGALLGLFAVFAAFFFIIAVAVYVYMGFAFMAIARKVGYSSPGIAWIPLVGPAIILANTAKMHWWPILLIIGFFIPVINWIFFIAFMVFWTIWLWKTFEALGWPGWWAILCLINILLYVFIGIAAWATPNKAQFAQVPVKAAKRK